MSLLAITLDAAVPLWIDKLKNLTPEQRMARARECASVVAEKGDVILFRSSKKGETANAFNHLAKGIALAAYQPGGITVFGRHWCVNHDECPGIERQPREHQRSPRGQHHPSPLHGHPAPKR